jgi:hypothetical protein
MHRQSRGSKDRADWPITRTTLVAEREARRDPLPPDEALAMMWQLALDAWASAGRAIPDYPRRATPIRKVPMGAAGKSA